MNIKFYYRDGHSEVLPNVAKTFTEACIIAYKAFAARILCGANRWEIICK